MLEPLGSGANKPLIATRREGVRVGNQQAGSASELAAESRQPENHLKRFEGQAVVGHATESRPDAVPTGREMDWRNSRMKNRGGTLQFPQDRLAEGILYQRFRIPVRIGWKRLTFVSFPTRIIGHRIYK